VLVHVGGAYVSVHVALREDAHHVCGLFHHESRQVLHVDSCVFVAQVQSRALLVEQVADLFVVDLEVGHSHEVLLLRIALDLRKDVLEGSRHDALVHIVVRHTRNRERLSGAGLTVGKDRAVVALDDVLADGVSCLRKNLLLLGATSGQTVSWRRDGQALTSSHILSRR
jgi:hypothetical protein